jgi:secreted trypsin-like serine protease
VEIGVEKIIMHPDWSDNTFAGDIALLKLKTPITFGTYVQPICLAEQEPIAARRCMITGWGRTGGDQPPAKILQQAELPIVDRNTCYNYNRKDVPIAITQQMICAGYPGTSARMGCKGDSGGPLVCQDSNNFWQLVGAVSFGSANCDSKQAYTVFANVAGYKSWIHNTMRYN